MNNISVVGLDIAKNTFDLVGINDFGKTVMKQSLKRSELVETLSKLPKMIIGIESCGSCHYWYRKLSSLGHEVKLVAPQYVKAYGIGGRQKNDTNDARKIAEAISRHETPLVCPKNERQQYIQTILRMRSSLIVERTKACNQARAVLYEHGEVVKLGVHSIREALTIYTSDENSSVSKEIQFILFKLKGLIDYINDDIRDYDEQLKRLAKDSDVAQRLLEIPGVGIITAMAVIANLGNPLFFKNGRHYAAYLGLVPRQSSSGGKVKLGTLSKQGQSYIRQLLIHGSRSVMAQCLKKGTPLHLKIRKMKQRMHSNKVCTAVANHLARVIWTIMATGTSYHAGELVA